MHPSICKLLIKVEGFCPGFGKELEHQEGVLFLHIISWIRKCIVSWGSGYEPVCCRVGTLIIGMVHFSITVLEFFSFAWITGIMHILYLVSCVKKKNKKKNTSSTVSIPLMLFHLCHWCNLWHDCIVDLQCGSKNFLVVVLVMLCLKFFRLFTTLEISSNCVWTYLVNF